MSLYGTDLLALLPELIIVVTACLVLALDPITPASRRDLLAWLSVGALALCLGLTGWQISVLNVRVSAFSDLVVIDAYARFWKILLYGVTGVIILLSLPYLKAERIHLGEYYGFILLALSGMMVMVSGADLLTIYLGTELMSISLYVLTGFNRSKPRSLEASAKYFVLGAFSSGILLYGISLLYGMAGSTKLASIAVAIGTRGADDPLLLIATILVAVGFGFKLAAVPFHMWTPDVYQGAPTSVTAFMAVAAKAASFAAFIRVFVEGLGGLKADWSLLFLLISVVTLVLGNIVAIVQTNIKRMLAYSSIAHAGYLLIGVVTFSGAAVAYYLVAYLLMTLLCFAVLVVVGNSGGSDQIEDFAGLAKRSPFLAFAMLIGMISLAGVPFTAGFLGKFFIFDAAIRQHQTMLVVIGVITVGCGFYYYLKVVRAMYWLTPPADSQPVPLSALSRLTMTLLIAAIFVLGVYPQPILNALDQPAARATISMFR